MGDRNKRIDVKDSILLSISEIVGVHKDYDDFDDQLIIHTNTVLQLLVQKGIGKEGVFVQNDQLTWNDFLKDHQVNVRCVISWAGLKVKSLFDPPSNPTLANALNESLKELEWMFYITENYIGEIEG